MKFILPIKTSLISAALLCAIAPLGSQTLREEGPSPFTGGQSEANNESQVGAINAIAAHPTNADIIYIGTVNGGVWSTNDGTSDNPVWTPLTDDQTSLSIYDLALDPTDATSQTLVAGIGRTSSLGRIGGDRIGALRSTDGGATWTLLDNGIVGSNISGVAPRGSTIVVSADENDGPAFSCTATGIFRSTDSGATFTQVTNGISGGSVDALTGDPTDNAVLFASIVRAGSDCGGVTGIYRSTDTGANWTKVSNAAMDAQLADALGTHVEIAVGTSDNVYVAIAPGGRLGGVFRSGDGGDTFVQLDNPETTEMDTGGPVVVGLHPGGQAGIHMSIAADPNNANIVYIGGDRQPGANMDGQNGPPFPNSLGANTFSGRMFRGDASQPTGSQWTSLTHSGTANNTSAHADSRDMVVSPNGTLLEADDGGIYVRTSPLDNTGDWFSLNAGLQNTEVHSAFYDTNSDIVAGGTQDNSQGIQQTSANEVWTVLLGGDGGDFVIDNQTLAGTNQSIRYTSSQNLGNFIRIIRNADNSLDSFVFPALTITSGNPMPAPQFVTPTAVNTQDGNRLIIGFGANGGAYESFDQGDTISQLVPADIAAFGLGFDSIVAGGPGNEELLYIAASTDLFRRVNAGEDLVSVFTGTTILAVAQDQEDITQAFLLQLRDGIFRTQNTGDSWVDITGNLLALNPGRLFAVAHMSNPFAGTPGGDNVDAVVVGADRGVYIATEDTDFSQWSLLSTEIPNSPVFGLRFEQDLNELFINTLGRGTFSYGPVFEEVLDLDVVFQDGFEAQP